MMVGITESPAVVEVQIQMWSLRPQYVPGELSATKPLRLHKPVAAAPFGLSFSVFPSLLA